MNDNTGTSRFPDALVRWAGHHNGGVRRPFQGSSGRPTGEQIETPLITRLNRWVEDLVAGEAAPRAVLLVGGPGNGKTDAVEGCIERLDAALDARGALRAKFAEAYAPAAGLHAPRKVVVDLSVASTALPSHLRCSLSLVQDATEGDPAESVTADTLLLRELEEVAQGVRNDIYICCVNRGILAAASAKAHAGHSKTEVTNLLAQITRGVTSGPDSPQCWPLAGFEHMAVWPMDIESLVAPSNPEKPSVAHQILAVVLDSNRWKSPCALNTRCPFCQNRVLLARTGATDALVELLHFYELTSGKRWTFRDLFSLFSYLLVGDYDEFIIKTRVYSPCDWAAEQRRLCEQGMQNSPERDRAAFLLTSRLYYHRLFPSWPSFDAGEHRTAKQELLRDGQLDSGLGAARAFFRFMARAEELTSQANGEVPARIRKSLGPDLDPAVSSGRHELFSRESRAVTVEDVETAFSLSVATGMKLVGSRIETLEKDVLDQLAIADAALAEDKFSGNRTRQLRVLRSAIRQYATRLVKRSIGARKAICRDVEHFRAYVDAMRSETTLSDGRRQLRNLLHDRNDKFCAPLATTFGQPVAERSRDVVLVLPRMIPVQPVARPAGTGRPRDPVPYFRVERHAVAVTFGLFKALRDVARGLHPASLPADIYGLLDRIKSLVAGHVVRDPDLLADEPRIVLGSSGDAIDYVNGEFHYSHGEAR